MGHRLSLGLLMLALATQPLGASTANDVVVVVSARSPIATLSDAEIADIFLGRLTRLPGGVTATPLDQAEGSAARDQFYREITGKSPTQMKAFWSKLIFTGRGRPPRELASDGEVLRALRENPTAIGYVRRTAVDSTARVLR